MTDQIDAIRAKRINILILFAGVFLSIFLVFIIVDNALSRLESLVSRAQTEYKPIANKSIEVLETSKSGIDKISESSARAIDAISPQIPNITHVIDRSLDSVKDEYADTKKQFNSDYQDFKSTLKLELQELKEDKKWVKSQVENFQSELQTWRNLTFISIAIFGAIMFLSSIQSILENARWFISLFLSKKQEQP